MQECGGDGQTNFRIKKNLVCTPQLFIQALGLLEFEVVSSIVLSLLKIFCTN